MMKLEVIMAGFGGQGIMMMGEILAHSAMIEGKQVSWIPSYGPEMRGGTANCMVVISDQRIASPIVSSPDILVAMNQPSFDKFYSSVKSRGMVIINKALVSKGLQPKDIDLVEVDATRIAGELGNLKAANMVALGALVEVSRVVQFDTILQSLKGFLPPPRKNLYEVNEKAFLTGAKLLMV